MTRVGFEPTPADADEKPLIRGKLSLESHTLDHSVILPCISVTFLHCYTLKTEGVQKVAAYQ